jgi:prophage antirepressor-like protein
MALQRFQFPFSEDGTSTFECWGIVIPPDGVACKLKELAEFLGYEDVKKCYKLVPNDWKISWKEIQHKVVPNRPHLLTSSDLPPNWQPDTLFVLEPGIYALMARSNKRLAKEKMRFVYETILPTIRKTGRFNIHNEGDGNELYTMKLEYMKSQYDLQLSQFHLQLSGRDIAIAEMERNHERQIIELKERIHKMEQLIIDMEKKSRVSFTQFAVNALLAKDNIEENTKLRQILTDISGPALKPDKEEYITGYERVVNGKRRIRVCRSQRCEIKLQEKAIQRYQLDGKRKSRRYAWIVDSKKFLQVKCSNPVTAWLKVRTEHPHMFYGVRYTNSLKTEMEILDEAELREKYRSDYKKYNNNFKALDLEDEEDCVAKCLTTPDQAKNRINTIVETIVSKDLVPNTPQRRHSNAAEIYTVDQVVDTMINWRDFFVENMNVFSDIAVSPIPLCINEPNSEFN